MQIKSRIFTMMLFWLSAAAVLNGQQSPTQSPTPQRSATPVASAESAAQPGIFYRLDFVIREMEREKLVDTRSYSLWVQSGWPESLSAGSEVPMKSPQNVSFRNVGVGIECTVKETNDSPQLDLRLNISDVVPPEKDSDIPATRRISFQSRAVLTLGKPTTVGIVEDAGSRHRFQIDVNATKLK